MSYTKNLNNTTLGKDESEDSNSLVAPPEYNHNPGLLRAMSMVGGKVTAMGRKNLEDIPFMTVANLVTALFQELKREYVTEQTSKDKKMRNRINKSIELINGYSEISNLVITGNPFKNQKK